jgi:hypothetical protein
MASILSVLHTNYFLWILVESVGNALVRIAPHYATLGTVFR